MENIAKSKIKEFKAQTTQFFTFTTTRPVAILMVVIGVVVFGWISYEQLPVNLMPDITYPSLTVRTEYTGTAPEEIETTISRPVEQSLGVVNNLVSISSISKAGQSDVKLEFTWDTDMNQATADVREKLDQVFLPVEAQRPLILRFDPSLDPIMRLGLYGDASLIYVRYLGEEGIKRILETLEGVAAVKVKGGLEEEIRVEMNEQQLALIGIDIQQVRNRLTQENINLAGGNLKEGQTEYLVRTLNEFKSVDEIGEVVIGTFNDREIKIRDVAKVNRSWKDREIITRLHGNESVEIEVFKEADANIVAVAERVKNRIFGTPEQQAFVAGMKEREAKSTPTNGHSSNGDDKDDKSKDDDAKEEDKKEETKAEKAEKAEEAKEGDQSGNDRDRNAQLMREREMTNFIAYQLPEGIEIDLLSDQSVFIQQSVDEVKSTAVVGGILAVIILFIFLRNLTATAIIGMSIPISIIATFAPMKIFDVTLNIMSLGGLALGIGMLVDNSIVVLESIARCRDEGDSLLDATVRGVGEVGGAVFASTLTTVAVFFPIVFVEGVAGQVFGNMALTVVFSLLASLAVALFLIPMLTSRETSKFTQGLQLEMFKGHIFHYSTQEKVDIVLKDDGDSIPSRIISGLVVLGKTVVLIPFKILQSILHLLFSLFLQVALLVGVVLTPLFGLIRLSRLIRFRITEKLLSLADGVGVPKFMGNLWPTYLVNRSVPTFFDDSKRLWQWAVRGRSFLIVFRMIGMLIVWPLNLAKFLLYFVLEIVFKLVHFLISAVALLFRGLMLVARLVFAIPSALVLAGFNFLYGQIERGYPKILKRALDNSGAVLGIVGILFVATLFGIGPRLGSELIPEVHQGEFNVEVTYPVGTPVEKTDESIAPIQDFIAQQATVQKIASVSGTDKTANSGSEEGEHTSKITVTLDRTKISSISSAEEKLIREIRTNMQNYPGVKWKISRPVLFSFRTPIEVEIHGFNLVKLQQVSKELEERMQGIPGVIDVKSNLQRGNPEVQIVYDRQLLANFDLNVNTVASIVRNKVRGDIATEFKEQDRRIDILVRLRAEDRESIADLSRLIVNPGSERPIPLSAVAQINVREGPSEIRRVDQERTAVVTANINDRSLSEISEDIYAELEAIDMPEDFTYTLAGQNKEMETSLSSLKLALGLAIFLVYIVMASQFESIVHPFIIIFTIPLALIGVVLWLFVFKIPLSIVVFLGMIMLAGIVVNNAIVLVDYINKLRERGLAKVDAIIEAGNVRLRPIMMTTMTTVLGLLPMALGLGDGAEIRTPMAVTVIIGLIFSTVLTLVIIPTAYKIVDRKE
jgi:HAE1 family hydrophobic/amphiphilic exporter-1